MADPLSAITSVLGAFQQLELTLRTSADVLGTGFAPLIQLTQDLERMQRQVSTDAAAYLTIFQNMRTDQVDGEQYLTGLLTYKVANILK